MNREESELVFAEELLEKGKFQEAEQKLSTFLKSNPNCAHGWYLLGRIATENGQFEAATDFLSLATQLEPSNANYYYALAQNFFCYDQYQHALLALDRVFSYEPFHVAGKLLQAKIYHNLKQPLRAEKNYQNLLKINITSYEQVRALEEYANFLCALNQHQKAIDILKKYLKNLNCNQGYFKLVLILSHLLITNQQLEKAYHYCKLAIELDPSSAIALYNYAYVIHHLGRYQEALPIYERAEKAGYHHSELYLNLGVIHKLNNNYQTAIEYFYRALQKNPNSLSAINNLGAVCNEIGFASEAIECYEQAIKINPNRAGPYNNLGSILKDTGRATEAIPYYKKALELEPNNVEFINNYLFSTLYLNINSEKIFAEHKSLAPRISKQVKKLSPIRVPSKKKLPIRIAYLSPDFRAHPVAAFLEALLKYHNRSQFQVYAYCAAPCSDKVTNHLRQFPDIWRDVSQLKAIETARLIHRDQIHILIELAGHTAHSQLPVLAHRPAPIQISYLGYPATTGLPETDFKITDNLTDPSPTADQFYTERLLRLPCPQWCFTPPFDSPLPLIHPPALSKHFITFASFNNLAKINLPLVEIWSKILLAIPNSKLFLKYRTIIDKNVQNWLLNQFSNFNISPDRLILSGFTPSKKDHLETYNRVDIALDTFPYNGTTTTLEALWMGVPVITLAGSDHRSRVGLSMLSSLQLNDLIAYSPEEYIRKAINLASDLSLLSSFKSSLRNTLLKSTLLNPKEFIVHFEELLLSLLPES